MEFFTQPNVQLFALVALILRLIAGVFFGYVLVKQIKLFMGNYQDGLDSDRRLLFSIIVAAFAYNLLAIYNNVIRVTDGVQNQTLNTYTFLFAAIVGTLTSIGFYLFYRERKK